MRVIILLYLFSLSFFAKNKRNRFKRDIINLFNINNNNYFFVSDKYIIKFILIFYKTIFYDIILILLLINIL